MIRLIIYVIFVLCLSIGTFWLTEHDGTIQITWLSYQAELSTTLAIGLLLAAFILFNLFIYAVFRLRFMITHKRFHFREKQLHKKTHALRDALILYMQGDMVGVRKSAQTKHLKESDTAHLLTSMASNDGLSIDELERLLAIPTLKTLACHGLAQHYLKENNEPQALKYIEEARTDGSPLPWTDQLLATIYLKQKQPEKALICANAFYKAQIAPESMALYSECLIRSNKKFQALRILKKAWRIAPEKQFAVLFLQLYVNLPLNRQLAKMKKYVAITPDHIESHLAIGRCAIAAGELSEARTHLNAALSISESAEACKLMADIEKQSFGSSERIIDWLERAVKSK